MLGGARPSRSPPKRLEAPDVGQRGRRPGCAGRCPAASPEGQHLQPPSAPAAGRSITSAPCGPAGRAGAVRLKPAQLGRRWDGFSHRASPSGSGGWPGRFIALAVIRAWAWSHRRIAPRRARAASALPAAAGRCPAGALQGQPRGVGCHIALQCLQDGCSAAALVAFEQPQRRGRDRAGCRLRSGALDRPRMRPCARRSQAGERGL